MNLLGRRSVASILSSLTSLVEQLEAHASAKADEALLHAQRIAEHSEKLAEASAEREKALSAATKISNLVS